MTAPSDYVRSDKELLDYVDEHLRNYRGGPHDTHLGRLWMTINRHSGMTYRRLLEDAIRRDEARRIESVTRRLTGE